MKDILDPVIKITLAAKPPSYKTVLDLDRKIREKIVPSGFDGIKAKTDTSPSAYLQAGILTQFRTITMLHLHRSFFAQALLDYPENPLRSRYAPSFLAASSCASTIIRKSVIQFQNRPQLCIRSGHSMVILASSQSLFYQMVVIVD